MPIIGKLIHGKYLDSVKLMLISKEMRKQPGVTDAVAIMATHENKAILQATDLLLPEFITALETDICIAVAAETDSICAELMQMVNVWIDNGLPGAIPSGNAANLPRSLESAQQQMPEANLALISVAGKYAGKEARKALELGLNVMLFSDNVSLETELALKQYAVERGLLMMGPDCGTAIINGVPLAFANAVRPGKVGIVSAAGTGLQEVSCIIHNLGAGISQAFGTGGRDGKAAIGGLMLLACLQYLIDDPQTEVIVLISKVPDQTVVDKLMQMLQTTAKPVVVNFLKKIELPALSHVQMAHNLAETGKLAVKLLADVHDRVDAAGATFRNRTLVSLPTRETRRYLRGLFSGGTLSYEAQNIFHEKLGSYAYSNAPLDSKYTLQDAWQSQADTIIDMGADEFTVGRPHPMIDYSLRLKKIEDESRDVECAVILLDVVLGYGAHPAPQIELAETLLAVKKNTCIVVICAVIGTDADPQNRQEVIKALQATGAIVTTTNAEACDLAVQLIRQIRSK